MAKNFASDKDRNRFELFVYLQLTCATLEECFGIINKKKYSIEIKKRLDKELNDFNRLFFKDKIPSEDLTTNGQYSAAIIGKYIVKEESRDLFIKRGTEHLLGNMKLLENVGDYGVLKGKNAEKLSGFFESLAARYSEQADKISQNMR